MTTTNIRTALRSLSARFHGAGLDSPALDARVLLLEAARLAPEDLIRDPDRPLSPTEAARLDALAERRLSGEPVARLIGRREFWGLDFVISPETLIPRPDTETLVEAALSTIPDRNAPLILADLGTGSGCLLVALLVELPQARGVATDRAWGALATARRNASSHGVAERAIFVQGDWAAALSPSHFDVIVSNPPYIASSAIEDLEVDVKSHDPRLALDGGPDGLSAYRALAPGAAAALRPGGRLFLEIGAGQADSVMQILASAGLALSPPRPDLSGRARVVCGTR